jgi:L-asparaginase/Glu-tRNA(Gln) amidotransferase subunit D
MILQKQEQIFLSIIVIGLILTMLALFLLGKRNIPEEDFVPINKILIITTGDFQDEIKKLDPFWKDELNYSIIEMNGSNDVSPKDWNDLSELIVSNYNDYDAFVILHTPDTLAYTASALSFMLENLTKTVVISPNMILATRLASKHRIPEVVVIDNDILRGCRTKLLRSSFVSPFFPPLGDTTELQLNKELILPPPTEPFRVLPINPNKKIIDIIKVWIKKN